MLSEADRLGPGGNNAPLEEVARDEITARLRPWLDRTALLARKADGAGITSADDAADISDLSKQIATLVDTIDAIRADVKGTYDRAGAVVQSEAYKLLDQLKPQNAKLLRMLKAYGEEVKRAREAKAQIDAELERRRQVEAAKAAANSERMVGQEKAEAPPKPAASRWPERKAAEPVVRGGLGSKTVLRSDAVYEVVDPRKLPDQILNAPKVREAIISVVRTADRAGIIPDLEAIGISKTTEDKAQVL